jgi:hypothetical protein
LQTLGSSAGFEIARDDDALWFAYRSSRGPALVAWICGGLAFAAAVNGVLWTVKSFSGGITQNGLILASGLCGLTLALLLVARLGYREYKRRRDTPLTDWAILRGDLTNKQLLDVDSSPIVDFSEVTIDTPRNLGDSTQGSMRWVRLRWGKDKIRIYSASSSEAERVAKDLVELGVGSLAD